MLVTFFSIMMSVIWGSMLAVFLSICRKTNFFVRRFGTAGILLLYGLCIVRMVVPLEHAYTKSLCCRGFFSTVYEKIGLDTIGTSGWSVLEVLFFVWIAVSAVLLARFVSQYRKAVKKVLSYAVRDDAQCQKVFGQVVKESKKQRTVRIRRGGGFGSPVCVGIFRRTIVLPEEKYSDQELYYILLHEYTHLLNHDLLVKMAVHIFCCAFWWNPVFWLLAKDLDRMLEIKCDLCVTGSMEYTRKVEYLTTIVSVLKKADSRKAKIYGAAAFVPGNREPEIVERFQAVSSGCALWGKNKIRTAVFFAAAFLVFLLSYSVVIQPGYDVPVEEVETEPGAYEMRPDNTYLIKNRDGTYTITMSDGWSQVIGEEDALILETQGFKIVEED